MKLSHTHTPSHGSSPVRASLLLNYQSIETLSSAHNLILKYLLIYLPGVGEHVFLFKFAWFVFVCFQIHSFRIKRTLMLTILVKKSTLMLRDLGEFAYVGVPV